MVLKLTSWFQSVTQHLNSCLSWKLARVNVATHVASQILTWQYLLALLHCFLGIFIQIRLENPTSSVCWAILKWLSLWVILIHRWHLPCVRLWLIRRKSLRCVTRGRIASIFGGKLRVWLSVCFTMLSTTSSWLNKLIIHWRVTKVLWTFFTCHSLVCIIVRAWLHDVVVLNCPEIEKWFLFNCFSRRLSRLLCEFWGCSLLEMALRHLGLFLMILHMIDLVDMHLCFFVEDSCLPIVSYKC